MTTRRDILFAGALVALAPAASFGQGAARRPVVAYVFGPVATSVMTGPEPANAHVRAFVRRLRDLGWEDGRNLVLERHGAGGSSEQARAILADLVARKVDLIYAAATAGHTVIAVDAIRATRSIPIVFAGSSDPVAAGLVASLARPGGNATGVTTGIGLEIIGKRLELLREIVPGIKRVAYLDPKGGSVDFARQAAARLGMTLFHVEVELAEQYDAAFATATRERAEAAMVGGFSVHHFNAERLATLAVQRRLALVGGFPELAEAGGLMSYGIDFLDLNRRAAEYVDKILRGAKPADLPVEQPRKFDLVLNLKTARALGLAIPQAVLLRADKVIE